MTISLWYRSKWSNGPRNGVLRVVTYIPSQLRPFMLFALTFRPCLRYVVQMFWWDYVGDLDGLWEYAWGQSVGDNLLNSVHAIGKWCKTLWLMRRFTREAHSQGNRKREFSPNLVSCTPGTAWRSLWSTSRSSTPVSTSPSSFAYVMSNSTGRSSPISTFNMMSLTTQPLPSWTTRLMRGTTCSSRMWLVANVELYGAFLPRSTLISSMTCYTCFHFLRVDHTRVVYIMRKAAGTNHL